MKSWLFFLLIVFAVYGNVAQAETIVAVFAHPDDETSIGPVLVKYAEDGHDVHLVITTDGRSGVTDHAKIPAGDRLVQIRKREAEASCRQLGIKPPIFLGLHDGLRGTEGMDGIFPELGKMEERLAAALSKLDPDVVITFGPGADSGHPDHRLTGAVTTQVLLSKPWKPGLRLYYFGWTKEQAKLYPDWNLKSIDAANATTVIRFTDDQERKHFNSIRAHETQYTPKQMVDWIAIEEADTLNERYFRRYVPEKEKRNGF